MWNWLLFIGEEVPSDRLHPDTFKGCHSRFLRSCHRRHRRTSGRFQWRRNEFENEGGHWSGAKVGEGHGPAKSAGKQFFGRAPPLFLAPPVQLVVLVSAFVRPVQFRQFLVCCSSTHGAPRAQPFVKVGEGARAPARVLCSRRHWSFRKTETMGTLASQAEIGVWVQAPGGGPGV